MCLPLPEVGAGGSGGVGGLVLSVVLGAALSALAVAACAVVLLQLGVVRDPVHYSQTGCTCYYQYPQWRTSAQAAGSSRRDTGAGSLDTATATVGPADEENWRDIIVAGGEFARPYSNILSMLNISGSDLNTVTTTADTDAVDTETDTTTATTVAGTSATPTTPQQQQEESPSLDPSPRPGSVGGCLPCPEHGPPPLPPTTNAILYVVATHSLSVLGLLVLTLHVSCCLFWDIACRYGGGLRGLGAKEEDIS